MTDAGFETAVSLKTKWRPDGKAMRECREHGQNIAKLWAKHDLTSPVISPAIVASAPQVQSQPAAAATTQAVVDAAPSNLVPRRILQIVNAWFAPFVIGYTTQLKAS